MEKECAICGIIFNTDNKNRKYCEDCAAHTRTRQNEYERAAQRAYWRSYYDDVVEHKCSQCGKIFKMPQYLVDKRFTEYDDNKRLIFCSMKCISDWNEQIQEEKRRKEKEKEEKELMPIEEILRIYSKPARW